jgi:murein L,D-transpeptidase YcbB/YkuD
VTAIKKRLRATGDYASNDTSAVYSDSLAAAIRSFEERNGLEADGMMDDSLLAELNVPAEKRMQQILVNMNRLLWMPPLPDSNRIQVNIPSFMLYAYEGSNKVFEMPVIVGKEGSGTVMFNDTISQIVFSPSWNLPESIVRDEILPKMKKDPGYLKKNHMEIVSRNGDIPTIRQLPGADNAMGRVKFLFPNSFDIYLHDTPQKDLFARKDRAQSHGCIRVADAAQLAQYLLRDQQEWSNEKISAAMNAGREQKVELKNPQLVLITYLTAWTDAQGRLNFRKDVYGHDQEAMERMFVDG